MKKKKTNLEWRRLDNSAKIFPISAGKKYSTVFRLSAILKEEIDEKTKKMLDEMHKQKIDMSDEIYVINVGGYIGESTKSEIEYAKRKCKKIYYLERIQ